MVYEIKLDGYRAVAVNDGRRAQVFVSNALSGTVTRLDLKIEGGDDHRKLVVENETQIASGYVHRCDPAAFVVGPTGVALDKQKDVLFVSSTGDNAIFAIPDASRRTSDAGMGTAVVTDQTHCTVCSVSCWQQRRFDFNSGRCRQSFS